MQKCYKHKEIKIFVKLLTPEKQNLQDLYFDIKNGHYGIPSFQRDFSWKRQDIVDLFDSVIRGYYIGSILLWKSANPQELSPTPLFGMKKPTNFLPDYLILDGQQRLSSIYYAISGIDEKLGSEKHPVKFFIKIDVILKLFYEAKNVDFGDESVEDEEEEIIYAVGINDYIKNSLDHHEKQFEKKLFPICELNNYDEWIDDYVTYLRIDNSLDEKILKKNLRTFFARIWNSYEIPIIKLPQEMHLINIAKIFEKLNTAGRNLTVFDLLNAKLTNNKILLRRDLWPLVEKNELTSNYADYFSKFPILILQTMCVKRNKLIKRPSILNLDAYLFEEDWKLVLKEIAYAISRIENLRGEYGIFAPKWHPYSSMMPGLSELMSISIKNENVERCFKKISCWFWAICYSGDYDSASDSKTTKDINAIKEWFEDEKMIPSFITNKNDTRLEEADLVTTSTNAMFKSIVCLVALNQAHDFKTGVLIEENPNLDIHHIFPQSMDINLKNEKHINSILNKTLISPKTNRDFIRDKKPSVYIESIKKETGLTEEQLISRFETHLISKDAFVCMKNDDFYGFIEERKKTIKNEFYKRINSY